ncbi:AAA family ATPase [Candidatus Saccharibacteria bacterium]|nr:AAA family ATPase [Candidatus Saccharibacteria bacterium]
MDAVRFDYGSERAQKARLAAKLDKTLRTVMVLAGVLVVSAGVALVVFGYAIGWVVMTVTVPIYMMLYWWKKELEKPKVRQGGGIDGVLAVSVLGLLPAEPTPVDIALAVSRSNSGRFLAMRFGLGPKFLPEIAAMLPFGSDVIWQKAVEIRGEMKGGDIITGGILALAIIRAIPDHEGFLAQLQLDYEDLMAGVKWFEYIYYMAEKSKEPMRDGGFARDWAFGYVPTLQYFGRNISREISVHGGRTMSLAIDSHGEIAGQMMDILANSARKNVAIVGPSGAGKTSVVHDFAEKLLDADAKIPSELKYRQVFLLDSAAIISAAPGRGEVEALVTRILGEAHAAKNIIICLDDAQLFFEDGVGSVDISNVLLPVLDGGNLKMILTMSEQKLLEIGQKNPQILNALNRINIESAGYAETLAAMQDRVLQLEYYNKKVYMFQALKRAFDLSGRYIYDVAQPGCAIKLLEQAANYAEGDVITARSVELAIEKTLGVKVGVADQEAERVTLLNLEGLIHERMINQTKAVKVVSDALRRARTGVRNQNRPVGTFLFLGPTGVGKTELAKALAEVYYGGEGNLVRVDLNQYVTIDDVANLTADGVDNPNSLTAQMMKNPFSVVLLDEIEKAHDNVLTALLQVLDEGILRDAKNREVRFRDAIVIATSNAGADSIRKFIEQGYDISQFEEQIVNELIDSRQFKPEFLNRFDEIVVFKPLGKEELVQVVDLMIAGVNKTLAPQKVSVELDVYAKELLVDAGYDPRLGARPMRRVVQRVVENEVAKKMLVGDAGSGSTIVINADDVRSALEAAKNY